MLDPYKLEIFECVIEDGSFSAAADRLMMSQSGVSQHIRDLEIALGTQLFERSRRGARPTASGRRLHEYAVRILDLVTEAENAVTDVAHLQAGRVTVAATPGVSVYVLSEIIQGFRDRYPHLSVALETLITPAIIEEILGRRACLGIVEGELDLDTHPGLRVQELETIPQYLVIGAGHDFWNCESVAISELNGKTFIMRQPISQSRIWLDQVLADHGITPRINAEFDNLESIKRTVAAGGGLAILPRYAIQDEEAYGTLRAIPVEGVNLQRTLKLLWDGRRQFSPLTNSLLEHLSAHYAGIQDVLAA